MSGNDYFNIKGNGLLPSLHRLSYLILETLKVELKSTEFRITLKRILIIALMCVLLPSLMIWNHIGLFLDDVFFSDWIEQPVVAPMFIIGNARSGTTWFHRLMTHDTKRFTTLKTWEIIFAVSITWRRLFHFLHAVDASCLGGLLYRQLSLLEHRLFAHIQVHPIGLQQAEEDDWLLLHISMSQLVQFFFPLGGAVLSDLVMFDYAPPPPQADREDSAAASNSDKKAVPPNDAPASLSPQVRMEIFRFYRQCVQRHLYFHTRYGGAAPSVVFVSKNPAFTLRIETLMRTFPDCRVVCLLRDPLQSVPSMVSYISMVSISDMCLPLSTH